MSKSKSTQRNYEFYHRTENFSDDEKRKVSERFGNQRKMQRKLKRGLARARKAKLKEAARQEIQAEV